MGTTAFAQTQQPMNGPNDSPVRVAGGSITFHSDEGWNPVPGTCAAAAQGVDTCAYVNAEPKTPTPFNTKLITFRIIQGDLAHGKVLASTTLILTQPWTMIVHRANPRSPSNADADNGIRIECGNKQGAVCKAPGPRGYIIVRPVDTKQGFQPNPAKGKPDLRYHHTDCDKPNNHCEDMAQAEVKIGKQTIAHFDCPQSKGCYVFIGRD